MEKNHSNTETSSTVIQQCIALQRMQFREERKGIPIPPEFVENLKTEIQHLGGLEAIEAWLATHDPHHTRPSQIEGMDWGFLNQENHTSEV